MSSNRWPKNRIAALCLTVGLVVGLAYVVFAKIGDAVAYSCMAMGICLGTLYVIRGSLPESLLRITEITRYIEGGHITADDDPRNISPRVYLPILAAVLLVAVIILLIALSL